MRIKDLCRERRVVKANLKTPALVPSFSRRGYPKIADMHHHLKEYTLDTSLVSAFDLHHGFLAEPDIYCSDVLFVDSGGYETGSNTDLSDSYHAGPVSGDWSRELHMEKISSLKPISTRLIVVNYDQPQPFQDQIRSARSFFNSFGHYASDFLVKPTEKDKGLDFDELIRYAADLVEFNIIGLTEKELGTSFLERCENLVCLRKALQDKKVDVPIHVFGSLDPLSVLAYFLSGADIFDGLSWLRYAYQDGIAIYFNSYSLTAADGLWSTDFETLRMTSAVYNLQHMKKIQVAMRTFAKTYDWDVFDFSPHSMTQLKKLLKAADVEL